MFTLSLNRLGVIKLSEPVNMRIKKTVLYGPNGGGKSTIIRALIVLLVRNESCRYHLLYEVERDHKILVKLIEGADLKLCSNSTCIDFGGGGLGEYRVARIAGDILRQCGAMGQINIHDNDELKAIVENPAFVEKFEEFFRWREPDIERFYYGYFKEKVGGWLELQFLPYGYKKTLLILYALEQNDIVLIEGFENALHLDLMRELLDYIDENYSNKVIVIETHNGLPLTWGVKKNWSVYYVWRDNVVELHTLKDLHETELFVKELEAMKI